MLRIITGKARGVRIDTLEGDDITRPTAEKVKEAIFSMIQFEIEGARVLDVFSGSGQLALEALSRGASYAVMGDHSPEAVNVIRKNAQKARLAENTRILNVDYKNLIKSLEKRERFNIVFIDPPYASDFAEDALKRIMRADILAPNAILICESDSPEPKLCEGLEMRKFAKYGRVYVTVLEYKDFEAEQ